MKYYRTYATLSECGDYRYELGRVMKKPVTDVYKEQPYALWIMLNPSTADGNKDDATIRRIVSFTTRENIKKAVVCNLFAYRATHPSDLYAAADAGVDIVGSRNDSYISRLARSEHARLIICAWGNLRTNMAIERAAHVYKSLLAAPYRNVKELHCLGVTRSNWPCHPVRFPGDRPLIPFAWTYC